MRDLGIRPTYIRIGELTGRGYLLSEVESAFRRYVPSQTTAPAGQTTPRNSRRKEKVIP